MNGFKLIIQSRYSLVKLQAAIQQIAHIGWQNAMQHAAIYQAGILIRQPVMTRRFFLRDAARVNSALCNRPRHDGGESQGDARHFAGVNCLHILGALLLIFGAVTVKIIPRILQQLACFIKHTRHEKNLWRRRCVVMDVKGQNIFSFLINTPIIPQKRLLLC